MSSAVTNSKHWFTTSFLWRKVGSPCTWHVKCGDKLQALVYDILPLEEGAGKRCSECGAVNVEVLTPCTVDNHVSLVYRLMYNGN